jgi:hypothetical protein
MPLYACSRCNVVENTALGGYWVQQRRAREAGVPHAPLCSECDPEIGQWHGQFPRTQMTDGGWEPHPLMPRYLRRVDPARPYAGPRET